MNWGNHFNLWAIDLLSISEDDVKKEANKTEHVCKGCHHRIYNDKR